MQELSTPAKCVLMASATLMIGFSTLASTRDRIANCQTRTIARGTSTMAMRALTYVTWPRDSFQSVNSHFVVGVLGNLSVDQEQMLAPYVAGTSTIQGRIVEVRYCANADDIAPCHALLVTQACDPILIGQTLQASSGKSVITIGDAEGFAKSGGVLNVVKNGTDSVLELNLQAASRQQLQIDARLVNVVILVRES